MTMYSAADIGALLILTCWSAFFSASEMALFSLPMTTVKAYQQSLLPRKRLIAQLLSQPRDLLVTVFMFNTLVNILLQNVASHMFGSLASWVLKVGVPLLITLIIGEILPKYVALQNNYTVSYYVAPLTDFFQRICAPLRKLIIKITFPISRGLFFFLEKEDTISKGELLHVLKTSEQHDILHKDESELVCGWLDLQDASVKELMRPRGEVIAYDLNAPLTQLIHFFVDRKCSRIPVCKGPLENVIGIISARDFFLHRKQIATPQDLHPWLSKPFFIPENTLARLLLRRLDEHGHEVALVVDEYGSISGLIAREDILELVIGQIEDLRDSASLYTKQSENEIIASGKLELAEFNDIFNSSLTSENNMVTIGGWLTEQMGDIPPAGTKYETGQFLFHVLAANKNRIRRLYIRGPDFKSTQL
jgi:CBS domain containing-hemolysin-like protein